MHMVSKCCHAEVITLYGREFPDESRFSISTSVPACSQCLDERPETIPACDCCGKGSELLEKVSLGYYCKACVIEEYGTGDEVA